MLVHIKDIVPKAIKEGYAIPAFNTFNLEVTLGIIRGAIEKRSPVIVQVSETTIQYAGLKAITHIVETIAKNESTDIPVALHLDHGKSFHSVAECIHAGFSSIHIDASELPYDENKILTKQAVDYAHKHNVWAQGELGLVRSLKEEHTDELRKKAMTDPEQAKEFASYTGVDTLAVAVGNVHGIEKIKSSVPKLDLDRLSAIHQLVKLPLVLHGASGVSAEQVQEAVERGVHIVNIDTELRLAFSEELRHTLKDDPTEYDPRKILSPAIDAVAKFIGDKIVDIGSDGKI